MSFTLEGLSSSMQEDALAIDALESSLLDGEITPGIEHFLDQQGVLFDYSEEGIIDAIKEKLGALVNKFQLMVNGAVAKVTGADSKMAHLVAEARASGNNGNLPIGKVGSVITGLGVLAGAAAAAAFGAKAMSGAGDKAGNIAATIKAEAKAKKDAFLSKFKGKKEIPAQEVQSLQRQVSGLFKRNLSAFGQHIKNNKGRYATAAAATTAVGGTAGRAAYVYARAFQDNYRRISEEPDEQMFGKSKIQSAHHDARKDLKWRYKRDMVNAKDRFNTVKEHAKGMFGKIDE